MPDAGADEERVLTMTGFEWEQIALADSVYASITAYGQDGPEGTVPIPESGPPARPGGQYMLNGTYTVKQLIDFFADRFEKTILVDDPRSLTESLDFIGRSTVSYEEAYQAMLAGYYDSLQPTMDIEFMQ